MAICASWELPIAIMDNVKLLITSVPRYLEKYCVNKTCRKVHLTGYNCNTTTKCKGKGICNNFGNCQCFPGHKPPDCKFQFGSPGGSIDDGNFQKSDEFYTEKGYNAHWNNWFILSFYIVLPFFIIFTIVIFKRNEIRKLCNRENTECKRNSSAVSESYDVEH
uniref:ADAM metallopeptidase domain 18 n=1 Tax=Papio anubis TaxID=9555 RepID=A0A8I5NDF8_PAPAN